MAPPVWFITAASSGFGHHIALQALERGHTVIATARSTTRLQSLAEKGAHTLAVDVTAPLATLQETAQAVFAQHGRVDYLVSAAGYILTGAIEEVSPQEVYDGFNTNVFGTVNLVKAFLPGMRAQPAGEHGRRGAVVTFGSLGSWGGGPGFGVYAMTKACASSLAESLRAELAPWAVAATVVEPGYFRTGFLNPGARVEAAGTLEAYSSADTPTGAVRTALEGRDGKQPGDVAKGAAAVVRVLTGDEIPVRIVLGRDCEAFVRDKCRQTERLLDEWRDVVGPTEHDDAQGDAGVEW